jgi:hypothetical protein
MKTTRTITAAALVTTTALAVLGFGVPTASAKGFEVIKTGSCSASTDWKLKTKADDSSRLEVELEIDSNRVGQQWALSMYDNGHRFYRSTRHTLAPSGSFSVERHPVNRAGTDRITATTRNLTTGEICHAALSFPR